MTWMKLDRNTRMRFARDESGSATMEASLWFPLIMVVVIFVADASMIMMNKARLERVIQDGNRAFAVGLIRTCPELVTWLETNARVIAPSATAQCDTTSILGVSIAQVNVPTNELDLSGATGLIGNQVIAIRSNHALEDV